MPGHCLRFARTPVTAQVMTQRSGSRVLIGSLLFFFFFFGLFRLSDIAPHGLPDLTGDLREDLHEVLHLLRGERLERAPEDLHRLDGDVLRELVALLRQADEDDAAIFLRALTRYEPLALHAIDDSGHRAVLRADLLGELGEGEIAD